MNAVGNYGTLVMPTHSGDWSDPGEWENSPVSRELIQTIYDNMPVFRSEITPTREIGRIAELFRRLLLDNCERVWNWFDDYEYNSGDFSSIGKDFEEIYTIQTGKVKK